jgi:HlyD family secretion protein
LPTGSRVTTKTDHYQKAAMSADLKALLLQIIFRKRTFRNYKAEYRGRHKIQQEGSDHLGSDKIGSSVNAGSELVRIADLSSFKVEGSIADAYANK